MYRPKVAVACLALLFLGQGLCKPPKNFDDYLEDNPSDYGTYDNEYNQFENESDAISDDRQPAEMKSKHLSLQVRVGETVSLPCKAFDPSNSVVIWKKDNNTILIFGSEKLINDSRISMLPNNSLLIKNVVQSDTSSNYSCTILSTPQIMVSHELTVVQDNSLVYITPPNDEITIQKGDTIALTCKYRLSHRPNFVWSKDGKRLHIADGTPNSAAIKIINATRHHSGVYSCLADDGNTNPPMAATRVTVHYPPEVDAEHDFVHTGTGMKSKLTCIVHANPHAKVSWHHKGKTLPHHSEKYTTSAHDGKTRHTLAIAHTEEHDFGVYTCRATNKFGESSKNITLGGTPSQPRFHAGEVDGNDDSTVILTWLLESYSPITEYKLEYRRKGDENWEVATPSVVDSSGNQFVVKHPIKGLEPGPYEAILSARNVYGWSQRSYPYTFMGEYKNEEAESVTDSATTTKPTTVLTAMLLVVTSYICSRL